MTVARVRRALKVAQDHSGTASMVFGFLGGAMQLLGLVGPGVLLLCIGVAFFLFLLERVSRGGMPTPRAWGQLDTMSHGRWRLVADEKGQVNKKELIHEDEKLQPDAPDTSMAMSLDGTVLATVAGHQIFVWTVHQRSGTIRPWREPVRISKDHGTPRILAVAPRGDQDVWLALADKLGRTLLVSHHLLATRGSTRPEAKIGGKDGIGGEEVGQGGRDTYASFLTTRLLLVEDDGRVHEVPLGEKDPTLWKPTSWAPDSKRTIAIDAARVGGRTYVALLAKADCAMPDEGKSANEKGAKTQLVVGPIEGGTKWETRDIDATHVSIVRAPHGAHESVCVLTGDGLGVRAWFPFRPPEPKSGWSRLGLARRQQAKARSATAASGRTA